MRKLTGWGIKTTIQGEITLWETFHEITPLLSSPIAEKVDGLLTAPDFFIPLPHQVMRFWTARRLTANKEAADAFRSLFRAMGQEDYDFLFCFSPGPDAKN
jgi:hypothetical protein